jgi:hypothetical protein
MVFRGRLVGGFPPSPVLILSPIKAPKEQQARRKEKCSVLTPTPTKENKTSNGNKESNTNPTIANYYLAVSICPPPIPLLLFFTSPGSCWLPACLPVQYVHHFIIMFFLSYLFLSLY